MLIDGVVLDPEEDLSRKKLFTIFKEAVLLGAEYVDEGGREFPLPDVLFKLTPHEDSEESSVTSSVSIRSSEGDAESGIFFNVEGEPNFYSLPKESCKCNKCKITGPFQNVY